MNQPKTSSVTRIGRMMAPRTVAVVGASATRMAQGNQVIANLKHFGFGGTVVPVHPTADCIDGLAAVDSIAALPHSVDVAVVCTPAHSASDIVRQLDRAGCNAAIVVAAGFAQQEDLAFRRTVAESSMVVNGPNCMGLINLSDRVPLYTGEVGDHTLVGSTSLVVQSGAVALSLTTTPGLGFARVVTSGNEYGLTAADYLTWFAEDDATQTVGLVIESIPRPYEFGAAVDLLHSRGKSVAVLKVGRSNEGARATVAHTGALVSDHEAYTALLRRYGVPAVSDYDELVAVLQCLAAGMPRPAGRRIGIVGSSGGQAGVACDVATEVGLEVAQFSSATTSRILAAMPGTSGENPVDLGAQVNKSMDVQEEVWRAVLADDAVDAVVMLVDAQHSVPKVHRDFYLGQSEIASRVSKTTDKPIVVVSGTSADTHPLISSALGTGLPLLRGIRQGLVALKCTAENAGHQYDGSTRAPQGRDQPDPLRSRVLRAVEQAPGRALSADLTHELLRRYGIPLVRTWLVRDFEEANQLIGPHDYPVVAKVVSRDVAHRSDVGGVELGLEGPEALQDAIKRIHTSVTHACPEATLEGFEIQESLDVSIEAIVGFRAEKPFGSIVMAGTGGVYTELFKDVATDLAPITIDDARALIARTTALSARLEGYRNLNQPADPAPLALLLHRLSLLARDYADLIVEADLNPILITPGSGRAVAVDALLVGAQLSGQCGGPSHRSACTPK